MAHDIVIRGGFLVDGTGAPGRTGGLAISGGRIAEVGTVSGRGAREIDTMNTDAASVAEIFMHPTAVLGLSDAGAHITQFSEAGQTSQLLGHWVRERQALSLEAAVRLITSAPAEIFGIPDRGRLAPKLAADVTIFDRDTIACHDEEIVNDMPDGGPRFVSRASGIQWSIVNGTPVIRDGRLPETNEVAGAGRVVRAGR
jgi:N-acyl-D-aspartate/D-glutamate deacylase